MSPESHLLEERRCSDVTMSLGWSSWRAGQWAEEGEAGGGGHRRGCVWPLVKFLLPKDWGYCLSAHGCPQPGTRPGQRQVLNKYL